MPSRSGMKAPMPMPPLSSPPTSTSRESMRSATYLKPMGVSCSVAPRDWATLSMRRVVENVFTISPASFFSRTR